MRQFFTIFVIMALIATLMPIVFSPSVASANSVTEGLYAGTSGPGIVYRHTGDSTWEAISPTLGYAVLCLVEFEGDIYAGTMSTSSPTSGVGKVWRYDGDNNWTLVGDNMDDQVSCLVEYEGHLYAGTSWNGGKLYRYEGGSSWTPEAISGWSGIRSAYVWDDGYLHIGDIGYDKLGRYDGSSFYYDANLGGSCIYDFDSYYGQLYAAAYYGRVLRSTDGINWNVVFGYDYSAGNVWELEIFQDHLYIGYASGELKTYDGADLATVWTAPDDIISMVRDPLGTSLFIGVGGEAGAVYGSSTYGTGKVYRYDGNGFEVISGDMGTGIQTLAFLCKDTTPPADVTDLHEIDITNTGFVYPTGNKPIYKRPYGYDDAYKYYEYAGWLARNDKGYYPAAGRYHIGQDIEAAPGDPVYAIADGYIRFVSESGDSWGWDQKVGGNENFGYFVEHTTADGNKFLTLYAHIKPTLPNLIEAPEGKLDDPIPVYAGQPFAKIATIWSVDDDGTRYEGDPHLHFGILPGLYNIPPNSPWGRMPESLWPDASLPVTKAITNSFVDPIEWITSQTPESPFQPSFSIVLGWTAPGDDGSVGTAKTYDIRYSTSQIITEADWESATQYTGESPPQLAGSSEIFAVSCFGMRLSTAYYFALRTYDDAGNPSEISNVVRVITPGLYMHVASPVDIIVTDPDGLTISKDINEIIGATYAEVDLDGDGDPDDQVFIPYRKIGDYLINVIPEADASSTDTYSFEVSAGGETIVLAENVPISDIPVEGYTVQSTEIGILAVPIADADGPYEDDEGAPITFNGSASYDADGEIVLYEWDFDDNGVFDSSSTSPITTFTYGDNYIGNVILRVTDDEGLTSIDKALVTVSNVPPAVTVDLTNQTVQYSDYISNVTFNATDVADDTMTATTSWSVDGGGFIAGLPAFLFLTDDGCSVSDGTNNCTWTLEGIAGVPEGVYTVRVTLEDDDGGQTVADTIITVDPEDATVAFDAANEVAIPVDTPGGDSGPFSLTVHVTETVPDLPDGTSAPGNISLADVSLSLVPVGPGSPVSGVCTPNSVVGTGYDASLPVTCVFDNVPVNTYTVEVTVGGGYYVGYSEDVLVVYDPSLGFTTGGGWFYWPDTDEKTNFGFTMKYSKKGTNVKGSLLLIRHLSDGTIYRLKSNALYGLALGEAGGSEKYGWASFSGKATYKEPSWLEPEGNYEFVTYVEDVNEPGKGHDQFWIEVYDRDRNIVPDMSMSSPVSGNTVTLDGGNIVVPHK